MNVKTVGWPMRRSKSSGEKASMTKPSPRLQREGVLAFAKSWGALLPRIRDKCAVPAADAVVHNTAAIPSGQPT